MFKLFLLSIPIVAIAIFGLCFNIIFRKDGKFPDGEISHNKELIKRGIICAKAEELRMWGKKKTKTECSRDACADCFGCKNV